MHSGSEEEKVRYPHVITKHPVHSYWRQSGNVLLPLVTPEVYGTTSHYSLQHHIQLSYQIHSEGDPEESPLHGKKFDLQPVLIKMKYYQF